MSYDMKIITELQNNGIELVSYKKAEKNKGHNNIHDIYHHSHLKLNENSYLLEKNSIVKLKINNVKITDTMLKIISKLINLKEIDLSHNHISSIPNDFSLLKNLKILDLRNNNIISISQSILYLNNLNYLYLANNKIIHIPDNITNLNNLKRLDLGGNKIIHIPDNIAFLQNLEWISLDNNQIKYIPDSFLLLKKLNKLNINNNFLPRQIYNNETPHDILSYILKYQKSEKKPMNEAKILVVGDERVGKTSVMRRLTTGGYQDKEKSTIGVDISHYFLGKSASNKKEISPFSILKFFKKKKNKQDIEILSTVIEDVRLNIWDFAGQEVTHTPHQYFMTEQSLYILVLDAQVEDTKSYYTIRYWLDLIKSYAGTNVPIVVIVNKVDLNSGYRFDLNRYKNYYPNIIEPIIYLSAKSGEDIDKLKLLINKEVIKLKSVQELFPIDYHLIKEELEDLEEDYIEDTNYFSICERNNITNRTEQKILLDVLNAMGTVVSYNVRNLDRTYVINPEWLTNGIYEIIRSSLLKEQKGLLQIDDLSKILDPKRYDSSQYDWFLNLMEKFEVCFMFDKSSDTVLVPAVFDTIQPYINFSQYEKGLRLRIKYDFLPKNVISRFIVKSQYYIETNNYWRDGVVLNYRGVEAIVKADEIKNIINIYVISDDNSGREFLNIIRNDFRVIAEDKLQYQEQVPLYMSQHKGQFIDYELLLKMEKKGVDTNYFGVPEPEEYNISRLLEGYNSKEELAKIKKLIIMLENSHRDDDKKILEAIKNISDKKEDGLFKQLDNGLGRIENIVSIVEKATGLSSRIAELLM